MPVSWQKAIMYGILVWIIMLAVVSAFIAFSIYAHFWGKAVVVVISGLVVYVLVSRVKLHQVCKGLRLGLVGVVVILDWLITIKYNAELFRMRSLWVGSCLTLVAPVIWSVFYRRPTPMINVSCHGGVLN